MPESRAADLLADGGSAEDRGEPSPFGEPLLEGLSEARIRQIITEADAFYARRRKNPPAPPVET